MDASATFIGNATVLLRLGAFTLLTDPNFLHRGQRAYLGHGMWSRRRTEPALGLEQLPPLETMSTVIDWERDGQRRLRLYVTGDTLFRPEVLREIPERFGDIDVALVHLGGTRILGLLLTMDGRDGVALSRLIRPRRIVPIHYEDYPVQRDPLSGFLRRAEGLPVRTMQRGQTLDLVTAASAV